MTLLFKRLPISCLVSSAVLFLIGLVLFAWSSGQSIATKAVAGVLSAVLLVLVLTISAWFILERYTYLITHGRRWLRDLISQHLDSVWSALEQPERTRYTSEEALGPRSSSPLVLKPSPFSKRISLPSPDITQPIYPFEEVQGGLEPAQGGFTEESFRQNVSIRDRRTVYSSWVKGIEGLEPLKISSDLELLHFFDTGELLVSAKSDSWTQEPCQIFRVKVASIVHRLTIHAMRSAHCMSSGQSIELVQEIPCRHSACGSFSLRRLFSGITLGHEILRIVVRGRQARSNVHY